MAVITVKGQTNAAVVLKGLVQQHGLPELTSEGIDALSAKFATELVIGHGVVCFEGKPLIDTLRAIQGDAGNRRFFVGEQNKQAGTLTERYRAEVAASRKKTPDTPGSPAST